jgi:hypothetical protein
VEEKQIDLQKLFKGIKLGWCMPLTWPYVNVQTHITAMAMIRPDFIYLETPQSGDIAEKRENQVATALDQGCTHIVFLDGDMTYHPMILVDMFQEMENGVDMVGGLCYRGAPPYDPLVWHPTEERLLRPFVDYQFGDVVNAGQTGCACLLVKRGVFEALERPWFRLQVETGHVYTKMKNGPRKRKVVQIKRGEDTYFTQKATKTGFKLHILTKYDIGHMREFQVDRQFWFTFGILNNLGGWKGVEKLFRKTQDVEWVKRELDWENSIISERESQE